MYCNFGPSPHLWRAHNKHIENKKFRPNLCKFKINIKKNLKKESYTQYVIRVIGDDDDFNRLYAWEFWMKEKKKFTSQAPLHRSPIVYAFLYYSNHYFVCVVVCEVILLLFADESMPCRVYNVQVKGDFQRNFGLRTKEWCLGSVLNTLDLVIPEFCVAKRIQRYVTLLYSIQIYLRILMRFFRSSQFHLQPRHSTIVQICMVSLFCFAPIFTFFFLILSIHCRNMCIFC